MAYRYVRDGEIQVAALWSFHKCTALVFHHLWHSPWNLKVPYKLFIRFYECSIFDFSFEIWILHVLLLTFFLEDFLPLNTLNPQNCRSQNCFLFLFWFSMKFKSPLLSKCQIRLIFDKSLVWVRAPARAHVRVRRFLCKWVRKNFQKCACGCVRAPLLSVRTCGARPHTLFW